MSCYSPISVPRPNGKGAKDRITVPCGYCIGCLRDKQAEWSFRLSEELKIASTAFFLTLTYSEEEIPQVKISIDWSMNTLKKRDLQSFFKRLRYYQEKELSNALYKVKNSIRYYAVGEYGSQGKRPHYHAIVFNLHERMLKNLNGIWKKGFVHVGKVQPASIHYVTGYVITKNKDLYEKLGIEVPFAIMSKSPPLGWYYLLRNGEQHENNQKAFLIKEGYRQRLPKFYKDKIFTDEERENIGIIAQNHWLNKEKKMLELKGSDYYRLRISEMRRKTEKFKKSKKGSL